MTFSIYYDAQPIRFLKRQDKHVLARLLKKIEDLLHDNPVPHDAKSIQKKHDCFRIRIGDYRVLYRINRDSDKIVVIKIDKRSKAYLK